MFSNEIIDEEHETFWRIAGGAILLALACGLFFLFRWLATPPGLLWAIGAVGTLTTVGFINARKAAHARLTIMLLGFVLVPGFAAAFANQRVALAQQINVALTNHIGEALTKSIIDVVPQPPLKTYQVNTTPQDTDAPCNAVGTHITPDGRYIPICR